MPVIMILLMAHIWAKWIKKIEITAMFPAVFVGTTASLIAIPPALFGWGKTRWLTLLACVLTTALCYGTGMSIVCAAARTPAISKGHGFSHAT
jgi:hypothetical protein